MKTNIDGAGVYIMQNTRVVGGGNVRGGKKWLWGKKMKKRRREKVGKRREKGEN